jgi:hypothetical protein
LPAARRERRRPVGLERLDADVAEQCRRHWRRARRGAVECARERTAGACSSPRRQEIRGAALDQGEGAVQCARKRTAGAGSSPRRQEMSERLRWTKGRGARRRQRREFFSGQSATSPAGANRSAASTAARGARRRQPQEERGIAGGKQRAASPAVELDRLDAGVAEATSAASAESSKRTAGACSSPATRGARVAGGERSARGDCA